MLNRLTKPGYLIPLITFALCLTVLSILSFFTFNSGVVFSQDRVVLDFYQIVGLQHPLTAGKDNTLYLEVKNSGDLALHNIRFTLKGPENWVANFDPAVIDVLNPGSYQTIEVRIRPPSYVNDNDRNLALTFMANCDETRRVMDVYVSVESSPGIWAWVGGGIALAAIFIFIFIFVRLNKHH